MMVFRTSSVSEQTGATLVKAKVKLIGHWSNKDGNGGGGVCECCRLHHWSTTAIFFSLTAARYVHVRH